MLVLVVISFACFVRGTAGDSSVGAAELQKLEELLKTNPLGAEVCFFLFSSFFLKKKKFAASSLQALVSTLLVKSPDSVLLLCAQGEARILLKKWLPCQASFQA